MVAEIMHEGKRVPSLPLAKDIDIGPLIEAREQAQQRHSSLAIFTRAYGLTGVQHPELRRALIRWPYPRLYEHFETVCAVPMERMWLGERTLLFPMLASPEIRQLPEISYWLKTLKEIDPWEIGVFREYLNCGRMPWPLRRFSVWHSLHFSGAMRARRFGTCVISSLGDLGYEQVDVITPVTTYFSLGPVDERGHVRATIIYDHRVMDGRDVAKCLNTVERILNHQLLGELRQESTRHQPNATIVSMHSDAA
jgi:hypothetical protein